MFADHQFLTIANRYLLVHDVLADLIFAFQAGASSGAITLRIEGAKADEEAVRQTGLPRHTP